MVGIMRLHQPADHNLSALIHFRYQVLSRGFGPQLFNRSLSALNILAGLGRRIDGHRRVAFARYHIGLPFVAAVRS
ncbi:hypothetical protein D3C73_1168380 [compost metagenome]